MDWKPCEFEVIKDIYWDNWGRLVKVFRKGEIVQGKLWPDGTVSAESTLYEGVTDQVDTKCISLLAISKEDGA
ncbi:hypothetical protein [Paenibacillus brevis]|uniref:YopX protein domain-containing protein n=1 Tax=Paenibacillus brevis TaxID=2841508 RepID=A0ABS6FR40_9BACL|nr:hypothetical protein [Paenibacillus brevis]MBU5672697.1 hypothetical protein [Paenibacillus brevis]